jgi:dTDP-4-dehydrorhamnose 3,5-epimerase
MQFSQELLPGTWLVKLKRFDDMRGSFVKTFSRNTLDKALIDQLGLVNFDFREEFYSISAKNVIRGMHFQLPPHDHVKLVYCAIGSVLDVLVDLRQGPGYGNVASVTLSASEPALLYIPKGIAHGFRSQTDGSLMIYKTSTEHAPTHDAGIRWNSFGFDWHCSDPVISVRDAGHPAFIDFISPF